MGQGIDATLYKSKVTPLVEAMLAEDESMIDTSVAALLGGYVTMQLLHGGHRHRPQCTRDDARTCSAHHSHGPNIQMHPD